LTYNSASSASDRKRTSQPGYFNPAFCKAALAAGADR